LEREGERSLDIKKKKEVIKREEEKEEDKITTQGYGGKSTW